MVGDEQEGRAVQVDQLGRFVRQAVLFDFVQPHNEEDGARKDADEEVDKPADPRLQPLLQRRIRHASEKCQTDEEAKTEGEGYQE